MYFTLRKFSHVENAAHLVRKKSYTTSIFNQVTQLVLFIPSTKYYFLPHIGLKATRTCYIIRKSSFDSKRVHQKEFSSQPPSPQFSYMTEEIWLNRGTHQCLVIHLFQINFIDVSCTLREMLQYLKRDRFFIFIYFFNGRII